MNVPTNDPSVIPGPDHAARVGSSDAVPDGSAPGLRVVPDLDGVPEPDTLADAVSGAFRDSVADYNAASVGLARALAELVPDDVTVTFSGDPDGHTRVGLRYEGGALPRDTCRWVDDGLRPRGLRDAPGRDPHVSTAPAVTSW